MNRREFLQLLIGSTVTLGTGLTVEGAIENSSIEVTRFPIFQQKDGNISPVLKVAFMSDFHRSFVTSREIIQNAVRLCRAEKPDVILLGGDFISSDADLAFECSEDLGNLRAPRGVFYVLGNHDYWHGEKEVRMALSVNGFVDLTNRNTQISEGIFLCGLDDLWAGVPDAPRAFRGAEKGLRLVFSHNPVIFPLVSEYGCVAICGHTHGGQINIPFVPNPFLWSMKPYVHGWFGRANSVMYVNRGIGMIALPVRFRCQPEITIFTVPSI